MISSGTRHVSQDCLTSIFTSPRGFTYHYIHIPSSKPPSPSILLPYVLFLHGFPSIPTDFTEQITHLSQQGYSIVAPYLLGYYPTSTPRLPDSYKLKHICSDIIALLDHLHIDDPIHATGHDWGTTLLSRLEYYYPTRFDRLAYLTIGPPPFGQPFDLDVVNRMTEELLGYAGYGYQKFFMNNLESGRAARLLEDKHDRMELLMFAESSTELWREFFGRIGGLEEWLLAKEDRNINIIQGVTEEHVQSRKITFCPDARNAVESGDIGPGYSGPLRWYVGLNRNLNIEDEQAERDNWATYKADKKVLVVVCEKDPIALPEMQAQMAKTYVENPSQLHIEHLDSGHFPMFEQSAILSTLLSKFFQHD